MLNRWDGLGRLTSDPEVQKTRNGTTIAKFSVAVDRDYQATNGAKGVDFIPVVTWRGLAEIAQKYLQKGQMVCISGRLEQQSWENQDGKRQTKLLVVADCIYFAGLNKKPVNNQESLSLEVPRYEELKNENEPLPF